MKKLIVAQLLGIVLLFTSNSGAQTFTYFTYDYSGGYATWIVPLDVTKISFTLTGASGGNAYGGWTVFGGTGGNVSGFLDVTAGDMIYVFVGGFGGNSNTTASGGWNGGGNGEIGTGGAGGGATDIRVGGTDLTDRIAVAGGGGGGNSAGGFGGLGGNEGLFNGIFGLGGSGPHGGGGGGYFGGYHGGEPDGQVSNGQGGSNYAAGSVTSFQSIDGTGGFEVGGVKSNGFATITIVPEPTTFALLGLGGLACLIAGRRRNTRF